MKLKLKPLLVILFILTSSPILTAQENSKNNIFWGDFKSYKFVDIHISSEGHLSMTDLWSGRIYMEITVSGSTARFTIEEECTDRSGVSKNLQHSYLLSREVRYKYVEGKLSDIVFTSTDGRTTITVSNEQSSTYSLLEELVSESPDNLHPGISSISINHSGQTDLYFDCFDNTTVLLLDAMFSMELNLHDLIESGENGFYFYNKDATKTLVYFNFDDPEAEIYIDGKSVGTNVHKLELEFGRHTVETRKPCHQTMTHNIDVRRLQKNEFDLKSPVRNGEFVDIIAENDVDVYVDGERIGRGIWNGSLTYGTHTIEGRKKSHRGYSTSITVKPDNRYKVDIPHLDPLYGSVRITTDEPEVKVLINGRTYGKTPLTIDNILIGEYRVVLKKNYFEDEIRHVSVAENRTSDISVSMKSSIPVTISIPGRVNYYLDGVMHENTEKIVLPEGRYKLKVKRQYDPRGKVGYCGKRKTIQVDSLHKTHKIRLMKDFNFDNSTFVGVDYIKNMNAVGVSFGSHIAKFFMFETNFMWGLKESETIYWSADKTASINNDDVQQFNYNNWALDVRLGPTFWCGPFLRISPQAGIQYLKLREKSIGNGNIVDQMVKGGYLSAIGAARMHITFCRFMGIHITPEYKFNLNRNAVLPPVSQEINSWVNGFGIKAGLVFHFY